MFVVLLIHLMAAIAIITLRSSLGRRAYFVGAVGPLAVLTWIVLESGNISTGTPYLAEFHWVPTLDLAVQLRVDGYSLAYLVVVGVAGLAIFPYAAKYFPSGLRTATSAATMTLFAGAMVGIVVADNLLALFIFWELTTISSYLLIGHDDHKARARAAALHAALVTGGGGLAMLGGLVLLAEQSGSYQLSQIVANPPQGSAAVSLAWALILIGAVTKSAQFPFHAWLPGAMSAPTPTSAFLHSATMVKAGIFLVGRVGSAADATTDWWWPTVLTIGLATMVLGGWRALRQRDLKLLLAFGTLSQLGFIFLLVGSGDPKLVFGGLALLAAHALFKASLFMVVGTIDHEAGTRDIQRLSGLRHTMPGLLTISLLAAGAMAALPLTFTFAAKEAAFDGLLANSPLLIAAAAAASVLTVAYTGRFIIGAFGPHQPDQDPAIAPGGTPWNALLWAPATLATLGLVLGLLPGLLFDTVNNATEAATGVAKAGKLVAWPGFVAALGWSMASLAVGSLLIWRPRLTERATGAVARVSDRMPSAEGTYQKSIPALLKFADRSSGLLQNGSLPAYIGIIALVAVTAPTVALLIDPPALEIPASGSWLEWAIGALVAVLAVSVVFVRRRFAVVILLGGVGYGIAALYAALGAPDLSLTQLLVETLVVALFAFVLRYLPATFTRPATARIPRLLVALAVGAFVFVGGLVVNAARTTSSVSEVFIETAVPQAAGSNVVNVILVDFRALDTLGEITVLAAATLGVAGLVLPVIRKTREQAR